MKNLRKKQPKNETKEDPKGEAKKDQPEQQATQNSAEEPIEEPAANHTTDEDREGSAVYITKAGEKYNLNQGCNSLRGYRSYQRKTCNKFQERTKQILTLNEAQDQRKVRR